MPLPMPMWPPTSANPPARVTARPAPAAIAIRRRWMIVDQSIRREVQEAEYRAALASCERIEVAHYPDEDVVTYLCFRAKS